MYKQFYQMSSMKVKWGVVLHACGCVECVCRVWTQACTGFFSDFSGSVVNNWAVFCCDRLCRPTQNFCFSLRSNKIHGNHSKSLTVYRSENSLLSYSNSVNSRESIFSAANNDSPLFLDEPHHSVDNDNVTVITYLVLKYAWNIKI